MCSPERKRDRRLWRFRRSRRSLAGVSYTNSLARAIADSVAGEIERCRGQAEVTREEACSRESYGLRRTQVARIVH